MSSVSVTYVMARLDTGHPGLLTNICHWTLDKLSYPSNCRHEAEGKELKDTWLYDQVVTLTRG